MNNHEKWNIYFRHRKEYILKGDRYSIKSLKNEMLNTIKMQIRKPEGWLNNEKTISFFIGENCINLKIKRKTGFYTTGQFNFDVFSFEFEEFVNIVYILNGLYKEKNFEEELEIVKNLKFKNREEFLLYLSKNFPIAPRYNLSLSEYNISIENEIIIHNLKRL